MTDDPVRRAFEVDPLLLPGPPGTAERVLATGRRRRQRRIGSLVLTAALIASSVAVAVSTLTSGQERQSLVPARTPAPALTASPTPPENPPPTAVATPPGPSACRSGDLAVTSSEPFGAGGTSGLILLFRNIGRLACSLAPYPGVTALDADGGVLSQAQATPTGVFGDGHRPRRLTLLPAGVASARVEANANPVGGTCSRVQGLVVTSPGTAQQTRFSTPEFACSGPHFRVAPLAAGRQGATAEQQPRQTVVLSSTQVAGVPIGTAATEAEGRLRRTLGPPSSRHPYDCNGENGQLLVWGTLTVVLSDPEGRGGPPELSGWEVARGITRFHFDVPYDGRPGISVRELLDRVPDAKGIHGEGETDGQYVINSARAGFVLWLAPSEADGARIDTVSYRGYGCD